MTHEHHHGTAASAGARHRGRLALAFALVATYFVVELVAALWTNSVALLSDAGHMLTDVMGLGMSLAAIQLAAGFERTRASGHTFGLYRLEILAAFCNALLLAGLSLYVLFESASRIGAEPEIHSGPMLLVATIGLAVNLVAFGLLRQGARESLNVEGAYLEVLADTVGSVGVIGAGLLVHVADWTWADPVVGLAIGLWILPRTYRLGRQAVRILLQAAPPGLDLVALHRDLAAIPTVVDVHDVHVWTLTSDMENATAHLVVATGADHHAVLDAARHLLQDGYAIAHATLQVEPEDHEGCDELAWVARSARPRPPGSGPPAPMQQTRTP